MPCCFHLFFFQAEDGIRDTSVTGVQTCALPISNTAGFHFAFIEQGGTSLYPMLAQRVTSVEVLRIVLSIGGTEIAHFQTRSEERRVGKECRYRWSPEH